MLEEGASSHPTNQWNGSHQNWTALSYPRVLHLQIRNVRQIYIEESPSLWLASPLEYCIRENADSHTECLRSKRDYWAQPFNFIFSHRDCSLPQQPAPRHGLRVQSKLQSLIFGPFFVLPSENVVPLLIPEALNQFILHLAPASQQH